jgi:hypothetical protein
MSQLIEDHTTKKGLARQLAYQLQLVCISDIPAYSDEELLSVRGVGKMFVQELRNMYTNRYAAPKTEEKTEVALLTKREYIAAMAMQGLLANELGSYDTVAADAVEYADALIEKLK